MRVLLVEDNDVDAAIVSAALHNDADCTLEHVGELGQAIERLAIAAHDVVLLDLSLPDSTGLATLRTLRDSALSTPVVVLTAADDEALALASVQEGAQDYLPKGSFDRQMLRRALRYAIERHRLTEALEAAYRRHLDTASGRASLDPLTGLVNRGAIIEHLERLIAESSRYNHALSVVLCDLDGFKRLNDQHGHSVGDAALQQFAGLLRRLPRAADIAGRFGGDEFLLLLPQTPPDAAAIAAERLRQATADHPLKLPKGTRLKLSATFGIAGFEPGDDVATLAHRADLALNEAKRKGRSLIEVARPTTQATPISPNVRR
ncbi:MAG TPA: diguanylate cyclase response regulator [Egibacteraceae bacterium]|nr:diguanylate cyclase response regulator [Egibacteraceae bacterium]